MIGKMPWRGIIYHGMLRIFNEKKHNYKAFTMAEAILVMTILGIIATVMITTLKPATYKEQALKILADKVLGEIDIATSQILLNDSVDGTMDHLLTADTRQEFNINSTTLTPRWALTELYRKYLVTKRGSGIGSTIVLKDNATLHIWFDPRTSQRNTIYPGETKEIMTMIPYGYIEIDTNGYDEFPNTYGKDRFIIPFGKYGLDYDPKPPSSIPPSSGP